MQVGEASLVAHIQELEKLAEVNWPAPKKRKRRLLSPVVKSEFEKDSMREDSDDVEEDESMAAVKVEESEDERV